MVGRGRNHERGRRRRHSRAKNVLTRGMVGRGRNYERGRRRRHLACTAREWRRALATGPAHYAYRPHSPLPWLLARSPSRAKLASPTSQTAILHHLQGRLNKRLTGAGRAAVGTRQHLKMLTCP
eukprot:6178818-Pleurochrysis_carterae.AAC.1